MAIYDLVIHGMDEPYTYKDLENLDLIAFYEKIMYKVLKIKYPGPDPSLVVLSNEFRKHVYGSFVVSPVHGI